MATAIPHDDTNWEDQIRYVRSIDALSDAEREAACQALGLLRSVYGEDFLERVQRERHPLGGYLNWYTAWTRGWLGWFGTAIEKLGDVTQGEELLTRLGRAGEFQGALSELTAMCRAQRAGFDVSLQPTVGRGRADLLLRDADGAETYVEVARLETPLEAQRAFRTTRRILSAIATARAPLKLAGYVHKSLSPRSLEVIAARVEEVAVAAAERGLATLDMPHTLELGLARSERETELEAWAAERGLHVNHLSGPELEADRLRRVVSRLRGKQGQLSEAHPNVVYVEADHYLATNDLTDKAVSVLEEEVYEWPRVNCLLITAASYDLRGVEPRAFGHHRLYTDRRNNWVFDWTLALDNVYSDTAYSPRTQAIIADF